MRKGLLPALLLMACGTALPPQRPTDFRFTSSSSGGMVPLWTSVQCDGQRCAFQHQEKGQRTELQGTPTPAALDAVYRAFRDNAFDRIRMRKHGVVYDAGGATISMTAAGRTYSVGASATESVDERDRQRFQAVSTAIGELARSVFGDSLPRK